MNSITFDPAKRDKTLRERGLDFEHAAIVFRSKTFTKPSDVGLHNEERQITVGFLNKRMVVVVWTERNNSRRIISMRYANERERTIYRHVFADHAMD